MTKARLTDLSAQRLPEGLYFDERTPGFGLRIGKSRRTWIVVKGQRRQQIRIGHYPALSLSDARKKALVTLGSPLEERQSITFPEAIELFLAQPRWRPQSLRVLTSNLRKFTWTRSLDKITHEDIAAALDAVEGKSARAHALKDIRTFFNWCVPRYLKHSPAEGLKMPSQPSRDRILAPDELKAVWNAAEGTFGTIVKLLILTGQRKMEMGTLKAEQVKGDTITIPADVSKNGREHAFPIGPLAQSLLPARKGHLFRSAKNDDELYNGYTFHLKQLQKASGTSDWTLHDLRRTFVTLLAGHTQPHIISAYVNHVSEGLTPIQRVYNRRSYESELRETCLRHESHILSIVAE